MNIEFAEDNYQFTTRACAIIYNKNKDKVLLFKVEDGRDYYLFPGGRIQFNEASDVAIKREIKEELNYNINFKLCAIGEFFLEKNDTIITQYCFCYKGIYTGDISDNTIKCIDHINQSFYWVNIHELDKYKIYPSSLCNLIVEKGNTIKHCIETINLD